MLTLPYPVDPECDLFLLYANIIKSLNERMQNAETASSDANILCVSGLAVYGGQEEKPRTRTRWPSQGPLMNLNGAGTYGQLRSMPEHGKGLDLLIKMRGGLDNLKTPGMAAMLSLTDISESTRRLIPTSHPHVPWNEGPVILETVETSEGFPNSMPTLGHGFSADWKQSESKHLQELFTALRYLAAYTVLAYDHCQGIAMHSVGALTDKRNSVQHRMLSVPRYPHEKHREAPHQLYESTRLAAEMYSLLCVYPCPPTTAPFDKLAALLRKELSHLDQGSISDEESKLLVWILVMGAIVAVDTPGRSWFISALSHISRRLQLESWYDIKSILITFLWLDMTNDIDGRDVWDEVSLYSYVCHEAVRSSSSTSVGSSHNMSIGTQSYSAETEEIKGVDQAFQTPW